MESQKRKGNRVLLPGHFGEKRKGNRLLLPENFDAAEKRKGNRLLLPGQFEAADKRDVKYDNGDKRDVSSASDSIMEKSVESRVKRQVETAEKRKGNRLFIPMDNLADFVQNESSERYFGNEGTDADIKRLMMPGHISKRFWSHSDDDHEWDYGKRAFTPWRGKRGGIWSSNLTFRHPHARGRDLTKREMDWYDNDEALQHYYNWYVNRSSRPKNDPRFFSRFGGSVKRDAGLDDYASYRRVYPRPRYQNIPSDSFFGSGSFWKKSAGKRRSFSPWVGKRARFDPWKGKRASPMDDDVKWETISTKPGTRGYNPWRGK